MAEEISIKTVYFFMFLDCNDEIADFYVKEFGKDFTIDTSGKPSIKENFEDSSGHRIERLVEDVRHNGQEVKFTEVLHLSDGNATFEFNILPFSNDMISIIAFNKTANINLDDQFFDTGEMFRLIAESVDDLIWIRDINLRMKYINPSVEIMLGFTPEEYKEKPVDSVMTPASFERIMLILKDELGIEDKEGFYPDRAPTVDIEIYCKDGSTIWAEIKVKPLRFRGKVIGMIGVTRDISKRKRIEEALKHSEARYRSILETIVDGYYEVDLKGRFTFSNDSLLRIFGYSRDELMGMHFSEVTDEKGINNLNNEFAKIYKTENPLEATIQVLIKKDGSKCYVEGSGSLLYDSDGNKTGFFGILRDVTDHVNRQQAIMKRNIAIEEDLKTAQMIQESLLRTNLKGFEDIEVDFRYLPLDAVGGDYFSLVQLDNGGMGVFIGDVASHGVTAALFLSLIQATTERLYKEYAQNPSEFLMQLNKELFGNMPYSFLTALYGCFTKSNGTVSFTFSSGGHPPLVLYKMETGEAKFIKNKGTLLSVFNTVNIKNVVVDLKKGDRLFLYTDGIAEVINSEKEILGFDSILRLIEDSYELSLSNTLDNIIRKVDDFRGNVNLADDILLLGFQI